MWKRETSDLSRDWLRTWHKNSYQCRHTPNRHPQGTTGNLVSPSQVFLPQHSGGRGEGVWHECPCLTWVRPGQLCWTPGGGGAGSVNFIVSEAWYSQADTLRTHNRVCENQSEECGHSSARVSDVEKVYFCLNLSKSVDNWFDNWNLDLVWPTDSTVCSWTSVTVTFTRVIFLLYPCHRRPRASRVKEKTNCVQKSTRFQTNIWRGCCWKKRYQMHKPHFPCGYGCHEQDPASFCQAPAPGYLSLSSEPCQRHVHLNCKA